VSCGIGHPKAGTHRHRDVTNRMKHSEPRLTGHSLWSVLVYGGAVALFLLYGNLEVSRSIYDDDFQLSAIERLHPWVGGLFA
jgi:hypothetical protein